MKRTPPLPTPSPFDTYERVGPDELTESLVDMIPSLRRSFASIVEACDTYDRIVSTITTGDWPLPKARARLQEPDASIEERRRALTALSLNPRPQAGTVLNWWADDDPKGGHLAHFALVARLEWERRFDPTLPAERGGHEAALEPTR